MNVPRFGVFALLTDQSMSAVEVALAAEARPIESLWLGEHSHMPVDTVHPYTSDGSIPESYKRTVDALISLATVASVTSRLRLGTSVTLLAEHNPIRLAKEIATLDHVSGGRIEVGIGYGWNRLETANNGVPPTKRRFVLREKLKAMELLWSEDTASFRGEWVSFGESWAWPKPVQEPRPPVLLGAPPTPHSFRDMAELMDGWMPLQAESGAIFRVMSPNWLHASKNTAAKIHQQVTLFNPEGAMGGKRDLATFIAPRLPSPEEVVVSRFNRRRASDLWRADPRLRTPAGFARHACKTSLEHGLQFRAEVKVTSDRRNIKRSSSFWA